MAYSMQVLAYRICYAPKAAGSGEGVDLVLPRGRPTFSSLHRKALADSTSHTSRLRGLETPETLQLWTISPSPAL